MQKNAIKDRLKSAVSDPHLIAFIQQILKIPKEKYEDKNTKSKAGKLYIYYLYICLGIPSVLNNYSTCRCLQKLYSI